MHYCWGQTAARKGMWTLWTAHIKQKKSSAILTVIGLSNNRAVCIASSKFSEPTRFVRGLDKVQGKHIQEQKPN